MNCIIFSKKNKIKNNNRMTFDLISDCVKEICFTFSDDIFRYIDLCDMYNISPLYEKSHVIYYEKKKPCVVN